MENGSLTVKGNRANKAPNAVRDCAIQKRRSTMPSPKVKAAPADMTTSLRFQQVAPAYRTCVDSQYADSLPCVRSRVGVERS